MTRAMKRNAGQVLLWTGFLSAALVSTREIGTVAWGLYGATFAVGAAGVAILRASAKPSAEDQAAASTGLAALAASLATIRDWLREQNRNRSSINVYEIHRRIDEQLAPGLRAFADGRQAIIDALGLDIYAEVMSQFATAERTINRAWSASADGYVDEVWSCLDRAESLIGQAAASLAKPGPSGANPGAVRLRTARAD